MQPKEEAPHSDDSREGELTRLRIEEFDKRAQLLVDAISNTRDHVDKQAEHVDKRAAIFGRSGVFGIFAAVLLVSLGVYLTVSPIVASIVKVAVEDKVQRIDWDAQIGAATHEGLKQVVTPEVLASAVDEGRLQEVSQGILGTPEFEEAVSEQVAIRVETAVAQRVDEYISNTQSFESMIQRQLEKYQEQLKAASGSAVAVTGSNRQELVDELVRAALPIRDLGKKISYVEFYPFDDVVQVSAMILWNSGRSPDQRVRTSDFAVSKVAATTDENRRLIDNFFGFDVPDSVLIKRVEQASGHVAIEAGEATLYAPGPKELLTQMSEIAVLFVEDCFEQEYPATWRVKIR